MHSSLVRTHQERKLPDKDIAAAVVSIQWVLRKKPRTDPVYARQ